MDNICDDGVDGGYYAIKGFLYQFDKTIIEILDNPNEEIALEYLQDINSLNYVIQCKYKETQDYANSKIKKPILQLIDIHQNYSELDIVLYCYFKNKQEQEWKPSFNELDNILNKNKTDFTVGVKQSFLTKLTIVFSCDFISQISEVIAKIQEQFKCGHDEALIYHGLFRAELFKRAINKDSHLRKLNLYMLKELKKDTNGIIFSASYEEILGLGAYVKFLKTEYFAFKSGNINNFERLFIIELDSDVDATELLKLVLAIKNKYYKAYAKMLKSPPPYVCLIGNNELSVKIKQKLVDQNVCFTDGTCFNGDVFRINKLTQEANINNQLSIRLLDEENLSVLQAIHSFDEIYCLTCTEKKAYDIYEKVLNDKRCNYIQLSSFNAIKKLFE